VKIFSLPMAHTPESVGYRIELHDGRSIAVSGDTDYCESVVDLARDADLLVLECSFPKGKRSKATLPRLLPEELRRNPVAGSSSSPIFIRCVTPPTWPVPAKMPSRVRSSLQKTSCG